MGAALEQRSVMLRSGPKPQIMPRLGLALWVPHLMGAILQTLTLAEKGSDSPHYLAPNPEIHRQVFHTQFDFGEILAWVGLLGFALGERVSFRILSRLWCLLFHRRKPVNAGEISIPLT